MVFSLFNTHRHGSVRQTVDEIIGVRQLDESFDQTFSKVCEVEGAEPSSPSAEGETLSFRRFSFCQAFSFAPFSSKEKAESTDLCNVTNRVPLVYTLTHQHGSVRAC